VWRCGLVESGLLEAGLTARHHRAEPSAHAHFFCLGAAAILTVVVLNNLPAIMNLTV
jgi:hypothetical protein